MVGANAKSTTRTELTTTDFVAVPEWPTESETVSVTVKIPGAAYGCVAVAPDPLDPSPNVQPYVYGDVPPETVEENETTSPAMGFDGEKVKSAVSKAETTTDFGIVTECAAESVTFRLAVKVDAALYA